MRVREHAEHVLLPEDRSGAGDEPTGSDLTGAGQQNHLVAGESISVGKLDELLKSDMNQLFGGTTAAHCKTYKAQFAVVFPNKDDKGNINYRHELEKRITADCNPRAHP